MHPCPPPPGARSCAGQRRLSEKLCRVVEGGGGEEQRDAKTVRPSPSLVSPRQTRPLLQGAGGGSKGQVRARLPTASVAASGPFVCDWPLNVPQAHRAAPYPPGAWARVVAFLGLGFSAGSRCSTDGVGVGSWGAGMH